jgi:hypothetical protein
MAGRLTQYDYSSLLFPWGDRLEMMLIVCSPLNFPAIIFNQPINHGNFKPSNHHFQMTPIYLLHCCVYIFCLLENKLQKNKRKLKNHPFQLFLGT